MPLRKSTPFLLQLWTNRIRLTRLDSGEVQEGESKTGFSNARLVFADFHEAERLAKALLEQLQPSSRFLQPPRIIFVQQMERVEGGLSQVELRALKDSAEHLGAHAVYVLPDTVQRSAEALLAATKDWERLMG